MAETSIVIRGETLPVPPGCTIRQVKLARRLLDHEPDSPETWTEMLLSCGYSLVTASKWGLQTRSNAGVKRATTAILEARRGRRDKVRAIVDRGLERGLAALEKETDVRLLIGAAKTAAEIGALAGTDDGRPEPRNTRAWIRRWLRRGLMLAYRQGRRDEREGRPQRKRKDRAPQDVVLSPSVTEPSTEKA